MPNNLIRVKQLDQNELSGFVGQSIASTGLLNNYFVSRVDDQTISGIKTFSVINSPYQISIYPSGEGSVVGPFIGSNDSLTIAGFNRAQNISFDDESVYIKAGGGLSNIEVNYNGSIFLNGQTVGNTGTFQKLYADNLVYNTGNQTISGNFQVSGTGIFNALDLNNIDTLSLSGVDITITSGAVTLTNPISAPNLVYNIGNQTISGVKTFISSGIFSLSGAVPIGLPNNPLSIVGSGNSYLQLNIQNRASGTNATADLVITANNGTDSSNYINLGINNSGYNDAAFTNGTGYDGYLFINGGNLDIGTQTPNKYIEFHIGGSTQNRTIARIDNSGINVVSGNLTVGSTGVLLSGQNSFVIQMSSSSSNLTTANTMYYFSLGSQGYAASNRNDRQFPFLDPCIVKKVSFSIQQLTASTVGVNVTGFFINSTKNLTGIIFSGYTTSPDGNLYTFSRNDLNIPFAEKDSGVCAIFSTTANPTNIRSMVNAYCYN